MYKDTVLKKNPNNVERKYLKGIIVEPGLSLNQVASDFYEKINGELTFLSIATQISKEYDVSINDCINDLETLTTQLLEKELVFKV